MSDTRHDSRFTPTPSPRYLAALQALQDLVQAEGADAAMRVLADAVHTPSRAAYVAKHHLRQATPTAPLCAHWLLGQSCRQGWLSRHCAADIPDADHVSHWRQDGHPWGIVSQPYGFSYETMRQTVALCNAYGLRCDIDTWPAWHYPGQVLHVEYRTQAAWEAEIRQPPTMGKHCEAVGGETSGRG